jgi:hypothetical protein
MGRCWRARFMGTTRTCARFGVSLPRRRHEVAHSQPNQARLCSIDDVCLLPDKFLPLPNRTPRAFLGQRGDRRHSVMVPHSTSRPRRRASEVPCRADRFWCAEHSRETARLIESITRALMSRARNQRAGQNPSRLASKAIAMREILRPALLNSSRQPCSSRSNVTSLMFSLFSRRRSEPGTTSATSQLSKPSPITVITVLSCSVRNRFTIHSSSPCIWGIPVAFANWNAVEGKLARAVAMLQQPYDF